MEVVDAVAMVVVVAWIDLVMLVLTDQMDKSNLAVPFEGSIFTVPAVPTGTMLTLMVPTFGDQCCANPALEVPDDR